MSTFWWRGARSRQDVPKPADAVPTADDVVEHSPPSSSTDADTSGDFERSSDLDRSKFWRRWKKFLLAVEEQKVLISQNGEYACSFDADGRHISISEKLMPKLETVIRGMLQTYSIRVKDSSTTARAVGGETLDAFLRSPILKQLIDFGREDHPVGLLDLTVQAFWVLMQVTLLKSRLCRQLAFIFHLRQLFSILFLRNSGNQFKGLRLESQGLLLHAFFQMSDPSNDLPAMDSSHRDDLWSVDFRELCPNGKSNFGDHRICLPVALCILAVYRCWDSMVKSIESNRTKSDILEWLQQQGRWSDSLLSGASPTTTSTSVSYERLSAYLDKVESSNSPLSTRISDLLAKNERTPATPNFLSDGSRSPDLPTLDGLELAESQFLQHFFGISRLFPLETVQSTCWVLQFTRRLFLHMGDVLELSVEESILRANGLAPPTVEFGDPLSSCPIAITRPQFDVHNHESQFTRTIPPRIRSFSHIQTKHQNRFWKNGQVPNHPGGGPSPRFTTPKLTHTAELQHAALGDFDISLSPKNFQPVWWLPAGQVPQAPTRPTSFQSMAATNGIPKHPNKLRVDPSIFDFYSYLHLADILCRSRFGSNVGAELGTSFIKDFLVPILLPRLSSPSSSETAVCAYLQLLQRCVYRVISRPLFTALVTFIGAIVKPWSSVGLGKGLEDSSDDVARHVWQLIDICTCRGGISALVELSRSNNQINSRPLSGLTPPKISLHTNPFEDSLNSFFNSSRPLAVRMDTADDLTQKNRERLFSRSKTSPPIANPIVMMKSTSSTWAAAGAAPFENVMAPWFPNLTTRLPPPDDTQILKNEEKVRMRIREIAWRLNEIYGKHTDNLVSPKVEISQSWRNSMENVLEDFIPMGQGSGDVSYVVKSLTEMLVRWFKNRFVDNIVLACLAIRMVQLDIQVRNRFDPNNEAHAEFIQFVSPCVLGPITTEANGKSEEFVCWHATPSHRELAEFSIIDSLSHAVVAMGSGIDKHQQDISRLINEIAASPIIPLEFAGIPRCDVDSSLDVRQSSQSSGKMVSTIQDIEPPEDFSSLRWCIRRIFGKNRPYLFETPHLYPAGTGLAVFLASFEREELVTEFKSGWCPADVDCVKNDLQNDKAGTMKVGRWGTRRCQSDESCNRGVAPFVGVDIFSESTTSEAEGNGKQHVRLDGSNNIPEDTSQRSSSTTNLASDLRRLRFIHNRFRLELEAEGESEIAGFAKNTALLRELLVILAALLEPELC